MLAEMNLGQLKGDAAIAKKKTILDAMQTIPGVMAAGSINRIPFTGGLHGIPIFRPGTTGVADCFQKPIDSKL